MSERNSKLLRKIGKTTGKMKGNKVPRTAKAYWHSLTDQQKSALRAGMKGA